jgi:hypothetical protein
MQEFINKYREQVNGTLSGFDRLVLRGSLRRLNGGYWDRSLQSVVAQGMEQYLWQKHILFKDYLDHVKPISQKVRQASVKPFESQGLPVEFLRDPWPPSEAWRVDWYSHSVVWNPALRSNTVARTWFGG